MKEEIEWAKKVMKDSFEAAKDEVARKRVKHKIEHTWEVVKAGKEIMERDLQVSGQAVKWDKDTVYLTCLWHDMGRFPQIHTGTFDDKDSGLDHASLGVEMIRGQGFKIKNLEEILEAIDWHSRKINKSNNPYAKLIRDADKTANFRHYVEMEEIDWETYNLSGTIIREEYLNRFLAGYEKMEAEYETIAEWYLHNSAWMWDLNFEATREIWREEKFPAMILNKLKKLGIDSRQYELIENKINSF